ncbi:hypothetical protein E7L53_07825 [Priestia megaterium]|nr:hypothetical protein [Priestia megaterium]QCY24896.1 hypothetical protein EQG57_09950 [Priestia megaterium NBRC 15308 = ATCC 14581]THJ42810.1 hypothetical protein E7L53_07825 [Priestia megaterium]
MKENPNDEARFLMKNQTRSDFFIVMVKISFMGVVASRCRLGGLSSVSISFLQYKITGIL